MTVTIATRHGEATFATSAATVGDLLAERGIKIGPSDYVSEEPNQSLTDGMRIVYRAAVPVTVVIGKHRFALQTSAASLQDMLVAERFAVGPQDDVKPDRISEPYVHEVVRIVRVDQWTEKRLRPIPFGVRHEDDPELSAGASRTIRAGRAGVKQTLVRFVRRDNGAPFQAPIATRIVRRPVDEVVARGTKVEVESPLAYASAGITKALHIAGTALHMIATAYTAGCYGCSGITATGLRAGFGIIAVDPHVIPLGTKLYVPGYGRAVAGDTGGAIIGNRIDLGMSTVSQALRFGRRAVTVYVLK